VKVKINGWLQARLYALIGSSILALIALSVWLSPSSSVQTVEKVGLVRSTSTLSMVSRSVQEQIVKVLEISVPELREVYVQPQRDGGYDLIATASVDGMTSGRQVAADISSRFLTAAYNQVTGIKVDFAALYTMAAGRYTMAAGLGRQEAQQIAISAYAPDQGSALVQALAHIDRYQTAEVNQAFAQYNGNL